MREQKTTVDYLRFRAQSEPGEIMEALAPLYRHVSDKVTLGAFDRGALGFKSSAKVLVDGVPVARLDYGGESQRGWVRVDMKGEACALVESWDDLDNVERLKNAQIRRLDIALTTWEGQVGHERVVAAHSAGKFTTGGKPPALRQITSSDPQAGRTCYVGSRKSSKFFRAYEKGWEIVSKLPPLRGLGGAVIDLGLVTDSLRIDGYRVDEIYRCELELKADPIVIGWDTVERRDEFFAGAYPFCAEVLPGVDADILQRRPEKGPQRALAAALMNCRIQYGNTLYTGLKAYNGDLGALLEKVIGDRDNPHLVEAGVLLFDHE